MFLALIGEQQQQGELPEKWIAKWTPYATCELPTTWKDQKTRLSINT